MQALHFTLQPFIFILFFVYVFMQPPQKELPKARISNIAHDKKTATAIGFLYILPKYCTSLPAHKRCICGRGLGSFYTFTAPAHI